jgi:hypothetical protein
MLIFVAISMLAVMIVIVMAVDGGALQREKRLAQKAADAAALAAAVEIFRARTDSVTASALGESRNNGFANGHRGVTVTVTYPTTSGFFVGANYVKVVVQRRMASLFASFVGRDSVTVTAQAVAGLGTATQQCLVVLDGSAGPALEVKSQARVTATGCGVTVNSSDNSGSPQAVDVQSSSYLTTGSLSVVGGVSGSGIYTPAATTGVPLAPDPMGYLTWPAVPNTCNFTNVNINTAAEAAVALTPGTYCGGITVATVSATMMPGVYYLRGQNAGKALSIKSAGGLSGTGVTFVLDSSSSGQFGIVDIESSGIVNLSAPTTGTWAGILMYQNPSATSSLTNIFQSGSTSMLSGTIYFKNTSVEVKSSGANGSTTIDGALLARTISVHDNATQLILRGTSGGAPDAQYLALKHPTIVE